MPRNRRPQNMQLIRAARRACLRALAAGDGRKRAIDIYEQACYSLTNNEKATPVVTVIRTRK